MRRGLDGASGLVGVLISHGSRGGKLAVDGYLVDTWCLGVKDALGPRRMTEPEVAAFRRRYFEPWRSEGVLAPLELARHLVLGAVDYARSLGFAPHRDFRRARTALGEWQGPSAIEFGRHGKPLYVQGPHDDADRVLRTLEQSVGPDNFHFIVSIGLDDEYLDVA
ncbi:MAG: helix-turn-helix domain-containing protein [Solirubrobacteraceae bacterium]